MVDMVDNAVPEEPNTASSGSDQVNPVVTRRQRKKRGKGLGWVANEVEDVFWKVAVTKTKLVTGTDRQTDTKVNLCSLSSSLSLSLPVSLSLPPSLSLSLSLWTYVSLIVVA